MKLARFYEPNLADTTIGSPIDLSPEEAQHLSRVLRLKVGQAILLFDGQGHIAKAELTEVAKRACSALVQTLDFEPRTGRSVHILAAMPKGDRAQFMIEKLTELNCTRFTPLITEHTVVKPRSMDKAIRHSLEACKQSERAYLMQIDELQQFSEILSTLNPTNTFMADLTGSAALPSLPDGEIAWLIGPEGGFSDEERSMAAKLGIQAQQFAVNKLRIETACLAACTFSALS